MAISHIELSVGEEDLLGDLELAPLDTSSDDARELAAARGIDLDLRHGELTALRTKRLLREQADLYEVTSLGYAVLYRSRYEASVARLAQVVAFSEELEEEAEDSGLPAIRVAPILRALAQGTINLDRALDELRDASRR